MIAFIVFRIVGLTTYAGLVNNHDLELCFFFVVVGFEYFSAKAFLNGIGVVCQTKIDVWK